LDLVWQDWAKVAAATIFINFKKMDFKNLNPSQPAVFLQTLNLQTLRE
jgi:hypothetical protein